MKKLIILLIILSITGLGVSTAEASNVRMGALGNLQGIVEDTVVDSRLNPARMNFIDNSKFVFADTGINLSGNGNLLTGRPLLILRLDDNLTAGGRVDFGVLRRGNVAQTYFAPACSAAYRLNEDLVVGGTLGFNMLSTEDAGSTELMLQGGFDYVVDDNLRIDGSFGINSFGAVGSDTSRVQLYGRGVRNIEERYDLIIEGELRFNEGTSGRASVGQRTKIQDLLLAHALRLNTGGNYTTLNWSWGFEEQIIDYLTIRAGGSSPLMVIDDGDVNLMTPGLHPTVGVGYDIDDRTSLDFNLTTSENQLQIGSDSHLRLRFSITRLLI